MVTGENRIVFENCLHAVKKTVDDKHPGAAHVSLYLFKSMEARGCSGHPNLEDHEKLAEELIPFFRSLIASNQ
jgi:hypothetical protein